jgi:hypothetical protein
MSLVMVELGQVCYDDFLDDFYLVIQHRYLGKPPRKQWLRMISLTTGKAVLHPTSLMIGQPDIHWLP